MSSNTGMTAASAIPSIGSVPGQDVLWAVQHFRNQGYLFWCGPAMGAFNQWVVGSFLAVPESQTVSQVAWNLLKGTVAHTRAHRLRSYSVLVPPAAFRFRPSPVSAPERPS